ncbi:unnamed protein product [Closterium sp. Yama58-4]|nr:unnamed protein product [Closterium sp. Yama58-4]
MRQNHWTFEMMAIRAVLEGTPTISKQGGKSAASAKGGGVTVQATRRGRGGKTVTVVEGLRLAGGDAEVAALLKKLKVALGSGGAVKDGCLELQGDVAERVVELLGGMGVQAKRSGGKGK